MLLPTLSIILTLLAPASSSSDEHFQVLYGNGPITFQTLDRAHAESDLTGKPMMLLAHKLHCPACKAFLSDLLANDVAAALARKFVVGAVERADAPDKKKYFPSDVDIVPRVLFFTPDGTLVRNLTNVASRGKRNHEYVYESGAELIRPMRQMLAAMAARGAKGELQVPERLPKLTVAEL